MWMYVLAYLVARIMFFLVIWSAGSAYWRVLYSAHCRDGNSVSHRYPKSRASRMDSPEIHTWVNLDN